jgi:hypothetical protein
MRNLLTSLVLLFIFTVAIFFGGAVLKVFGTLDGPGVIEESSSRKSACKIEQLGSML